MEQRGRRGRKGKAAVERQMVSPAPIVSRLTGSHGGAKHKGGSVMSGIHQLHGRWEQKIETWKQRLKG